VSWEALDAIATRVRPLRTDDLERVVEIDAHHTGTTKRDYWERAFANFLAGDPGRIGLGAERENLLAGYLLGEVRAFEFGSEACGWVFAIGVDPRWLRGGVASALLEEACRRFRRAGVTRVRTMVRRNEVPVLSFFRTNGFRGGPFVQLERDLGEE
jgi:ribosomal protein S18 acetylase RimI-like enzyme